MLTLGIDSSTQGTKAVILDSDSGKVVASAAVNYGRDLPEYNSPEGFLPCDDASVRHANPAMWIDGLHLVLKRLHDSGAPMGDVAAIGGDAQQHATVYLDADGKLSRPTSPIWMDSSTSCECAELDARFGAELVARTGSPATERFAAAQVMKFKREEPAAYARTKRICLLSTYLTSHLVGHDAPVESGDGAGMNLMNLQTMKWDDEICNFIDADLFGKLPEIVCDGQHANLQLSACFEEYGLKAGIPVAPFTGDNPASLVGCGAGECGTAVLSLGTSDTFFAAMSDFRPDPDGYGNIFGNPLGGFMSLVCFKNGSLARDRVRRDAGVGWEFFDKTAFELTKSGNDGKMAFPYFEVEITPHHDATGIEANFDFDAAPPEVRIRAIVEGQIRNVFDRTRHFGTFDRIIVTGGASKSVGIRSVISNVFGAEVQTLDSTDSAAIGGAMIAARLA